MATSERISIQSHLHPHPQPPPHTHTHTLPSFCVRVQRLRKCIHQQFRACAEKQSGLFLPAAVTPAQGSDTCLVRMFQPRWEDVSSSRTAVGTFSRPSVSVRNRVAAAGERVRSKALPPRLFVFCVLFFLSERRQIEINFKRTPCPSDNLCLAA